MNKSISFLLIIVIFFTACQQNNIQLGEEKGQQVISQESGANFATISKVSYNRADYSIDPSNSENPYDIMGYLHNDAIKFIVESYNPSPNGVEAQINQLTIDYVAQLGYSLNPGYFPNDFVDTYFNGDWESTLVNRVSDDLGYEQSFTDEFRSLLNHVLSFDPNTMDINTLKGQIISWEEDVLSSALASTLKQDLLCMSSIARWSSVLWFDAYHGISTIDFPSDLSPNFAATKTWQGGVSSDLTTGLEAGVGAAATTGVGVFITGGAAAPLLPAVGGVGFLVGAFYGSIKYAFF